MLDTEIVLTNEYMPMKWASSNIIDGHPKPYYERKPKHSNMEAYRAKRKLRNRMRRESK